MALRNSMPSTVVELRSSSKMPREVMEAQALSSRARLRGSKALSVASATLGLSTSVRAAPLCNELAVMPCGVAAIRHIAPSDEGRPTKPHGPNLADKNKLGESRGTPPRRNGANSSLKKPAATSSCAMTNGPPKKTRMPSGGSAAGQRTLEKPFGLDKHWLPQWERLNPRSRAGCLRLAWRCQRY